MQAARPVRHAAGTPQRKNMAREKFRSCATERLWTPVAPSSSRDVRGAASAGMPERCAQGRAATRSGRKQRPVQETREMRPRIKKRAGATSRRSRQVSHGLADLIGDERRKPLDRREECGEVGISGVLRAERGEAQRRCHGERLGEGRRRAQPQRPGDHAGAKALAEHRSGQASPELWALLAPRGQGLPCLFPRRRSARARRLQD
mmetsp:Transcript_2071/g.5890  ORF Transcript_2071/g.5890 Transcript_2071/m.5890 type:complete len:205 (-) Transcript_2071:790-1404(-)